MHYIITRPYSIQDGKIYFLKIHWPIVCSLKDQINITKVTTRHNISGGKLDLLHTSLIMD